MRRSTVVAWWTLATSLVAAAPAHAYIGPGTGLTAIGAFLALVAAIVVAIVGFVWYPIKRLFRRRGPSGD